jgi:hypothetical protein
MRKANAREFGNLIKVHRVLAAAGLEKGKKCPLALTSERRAA